jgi:hypothetical protein
VAALSLALAVGVSGCGSGSSSSTTAPPATTAKSNAHTSEKGSGGGGNESAADTSIQGYGAAAGGANESAVSGAVHSFLTAMADRDFKGMCAALALSNREQLAQFAGGKGGAGGCATALGKLLNPSVTSEARAAANASITSVRIKGDTAFAIFTPKGGSESYLVVKREGGAWRAISVTPGTPLEPTADP